MVSGVQDSGRVAARAGRGLGSALKRQRAGLERRGVGLRDRSLGARALSRSAGRSRSAGTSELAFSHHDKPVTYHGIRPVLLPATCPGLRIQHEIGDVRSEPTV